MPESVFFERDVGLGSKETQRKNTPLNKPIYVYIDIDPRSHVNAAMISCGGLYPVTPVFLRVL
jgi:hypothetical protein